MDKLIQLSHEFKRRGLYDEKFELSVCLAKIAAEQLELWPTEEHVYSCVICKQPSVQEKVTFYDEDDLALRNISLQYETGTGTYPVCDDCEEKIKYTCAICGEQTDDYDINFREEEEITGRNLELKYELEGDTYPVCSECEEERMKLPCAICEGEIESGSEMEVAYDTLTDADVDPMYVLPSGENYHVCEDCFYDELYENCADCYDSYPKGEMEHYNRSNDKICESCAQNYASCSSCDAMIDLDSGNWYSHPEYGEIYCEDCGMPNQNDIHQLDRDLTNVQRESLYNPNSHMPLSGFTISKTIGLLSNLYKKYQSREEVPPKATRNFLATVMRQQIPETDKKFIKEFLLIPAWEYDEKSQDTLDVSKIKTILDHDSYRREFLEQFSKEFAPVKGIKSLKGFAPMDVTFTVKEPRDQEKMRSFVVVMRPSESMLRNGRDIFGGASDIAWNAMSKGGTYHFSGAICYARIGNNDGEWVIDNLQRDADVKNFLKQKERIQSSLSEPEKIDDIEKAAKWWFKQTNHWATQMILVLRELAKKSGAELYLTTFELQKEKWHSLPDKNEAIYDKIPKELGIMRQKAQELAGVPEEERDPYPALVEYEGAVEEIDDWGGDIKDLWRIANRIKRLVKLAKFQTD